MIRWTDPTEDPKCNAIVIIVMEHIEDSGKRKNDTMIMKCKKRCGTYEKMKHQEVKIDNGKNGKLTQRKDKSLDTLQHINFPLFNPCSNPTTRFTARL